MNNERKSLFIVPGNNPRMLQEAQVFASDAIMFDLVSQVPPEEKDAARILVKEALHFLDYADVEIIVRVNSLDSGYGLADIERIGTAHPDTIMVPQATETQLIQIDNILTGIEQKERFPAGSIGLIPIIQTAYALEYVKDILKASPRVKGAYFNAEGLAADLGIPRVKDSDQIIYARSRIAIACRAEGLDAIDTPYMDGNDTEALVQDTTKAKYLGLTGKAAIDARQIDIINEIFAS